MTKISLLNKDTSTAIDKIKKIMAEKKENPSLENTSLEMASLKNESSKKQEDIKFNHSYNNDLSKTGIGNTMRGTNEVLKNQNPIIKQLKENSMGQIIPIKKIILEFTADHIRDNAGKYAAGTMLGLGAAAGYLAGDPDHGSNLFNHDSNHTPMNNQSSNQNNDHTTIKMPNGTSHPVDYRTGKGGGLGDHLSQWANDRGAINHHQNVMDAVNSDPSFLSAGEKAGLVGGIGLLGAGGLSAAAYKRGKKGKSFIPGTSKQSNPGTNTPGI